MKPAIDLKAIRARAAAATAGPWHWDDEFQEVRAGKPGAYAAEAIVETDNGVYGPRRSDAMFIAHSREDIPALLDLIDELQARLGGAP